MNIDENKNLFFDSFTTFLSVGNNRKLELTKKNLTSDQALEIFVKYVDFCSDKELDYIQKYCLFSEYYNKFLYPNKTLSDAEESNLLKKIIEVDTKARENPINIEHHPTEYELFTELLRIRLNEKEFQKKGKRLNVFDIIKTEHRMKKLYDIDYTEEITPYTKKFIRDNFSIKRTSKQPRTIKGFSLNYRSKYNYADPDYVKSRLLKGGKIIAIAAAILGGVAAGTTLNDYISTTNDINNYSYSQAISEGRTLSDMGLSEDTIKDFQEIDKLLEKYKTNIPTTEEILNLIEKEQNLHKEILFDKTKLAFKKAYPEAKLESISDPIPIKNHQDTSKILGYYIKLEEYHKDFRNPVPKTLYLSDNMWWNKNTKDFVDFAKNLKTHSENINQLINETDNEYDLASNYKNIINSLIEDKKRLDDLVACDLTIEEKNLFDRYNYSANDSMKITPTIPDDDRTIE